MSIAERDIHQRSLVKIISRLEQWLNEGELRATPTLVYLDENTRVKPDLFWVNPESERCRLDEQGYWTGVPDLVIEILSPATEAIDRGEKYHIYEQARVLEYWLINPELQFIEVYLQMKQRFIRQGLFQIGDNFNSGCLGGRSIDVGALLGQAATQVTE